MKTKILYIEDEPHLGRIVAETLEKQGFQIVWETDGLKVEEHLRVFSPDICVLDIMLPKVDGYELCRQIKVMKPELPVIFLTAKTETMDLVKGFEAGGTEYIKKPFSIEELVVRIHNQLRLTGGIGRGGDGEKGRIGDGIEIGRYMYYPERYELITAEKTIQLSVRDNEILSILSVSQNRVIDRRQILKQVWGDDSFFNSRNLDVYINKIRDYLSLDPEIKIQTLKGKGYLFLVRS